MFQNNLSDTITKFEIIKNAKLYHNGVAVASINRPVGRIIAAQAADDLLNVEGVDASFVLFPDKGGVILSGRSVGNVNVQGHSGGTGGGGNGAAAGAQVPDATTEMVYAQLMRPSTTISAIWRNPAPPQTRRDNRFHSPRRPPSGRRSGFFILHSIPQRRSTL